MTSTLAVLALLVAASAAGAADNRDNDETSKSFSYAIYKEQEGPITILLGSFPAAAAAEEPFFPVEIAIGLRGKKDDTLTITSESFTLIDHDGMHYPLAGLKEVREAQEQIRYSPGSAGAYHLETGEQFTNSFFVEANFFPVAAAGIRLDPVQLGRWNYTKDVLYFPRPALGLDGLLTLRFRTQEMTRPLDVRFKVPLKKTN
jgi:hypothetical protein